jgi:hypothetical protein
VYVLQTPATFKMKWKCLDWTKGEAMATYAEERDERLNERVHGKQKSVQHVYEAKYTDKDGQEQTQLIAAPGLLQAARKFERLELKGADLTFIGRRDEMVV